MVSQEYGKVIRTYRGKGKLRRNNGDEFPCYIIIQQIETGLIYITCRFAPKVAQATSTIQFIMEFRMPEVELVYGKTKDGLSFKSKAKLHTIHTKAGLFSNKSSVLILLAQEVNVWKENNYYSGCYKFSVVNFEFMGNHATKRITQDGTKQVEHQYLDLELSTPWGLAIIDPVPDYKDVIQRIKAQKGISVTCKVTVKPLISMELEEVASKLDELCRLLSLARGTKINWVNAESIDSSGNPTYIILKQSVTWPFSSLPLIDPRNPQDTALFIEKVYPAYLKLRDSYNLNIAIEQYLDAKRATAYLETRALTAVSLLDFLQGQYAFQHGLNKISSKFSKDKLKKLRIHLEDYLVELLPDIDGSVLSEMVEKVPELNRRSYLNLLILWACDLKLDISKDELTKIKDTRNSLVHGAKFLSGDSTGKTREYFRIIRLIDQVFLKLLGYDGYFIDVNLDTLRFERHMLNHTGSIEQQNV